MRDTCTTEFKDVAFKNGFLNLDIGVLEAHDPTRFVTSMSPHDYNPEETLSKVSKGFLNAVSGGDPKVVALVRLCGYFILHPSVAQTHHVGFMLYGSPGSGKSTLCHWFSSLVPNQAQAFDLNSLKKPFTRAQVSDKQLILLHEIHHIDSAEALWIKAMLYRLLKHFVYLSSGRDKGKKNRGF